MEWVIQQNPEQKYINGTHISSLLVPLDSTKFTLLLFLVFLGSEMRRLNTSELNGAWENNMITGRSCTGPYIAVQICLLPTQHSSAQSDV